jgi:hypothetical protein
MQDLLGRELTNNLDGRCFYILIIKTEVGKHWSHHARAYGGNPVDKQPLFFSTVDNELLAEGLK